MSGVKTSTFPPEKLNFKVAYNGNIEVLALRSVALVQYLTGVFSLIYRLPL